ncbi:hypothetical protein B0187_01240 [Haemophilus paracuniculus]|uniref:Uncharacterized protein n=1 Tax=Haemophilus paracuniculus TaxID=734 RepID=A0A1T0AV22_9PAST|nr:hypothetical protein [Haemophilus paracuniculus]OOS00559.1 hypothetical protein B0187_01240 [Haemophilus paracuniculus]
MWTIFNIAFQQVEKKAKRLFFKTKKEISFSSFEDIRIYSEQLPNFEKEFNTIIKIWLPDIVYDCIQRQKGVGFLGFSNAEIIRNILIIHCYGFSAFQQIRGRNKSTPSQQEKESNKLYSRSIEWENDQLGKNVNGVKISCHTKLKEDLQRLADLRELSLGEYIRKVITTHCLGNGFIPFDEALSSQEVELRNKIIRDFLAQE